MRKRGTSTTSQPLPEAGRGVRIDKLLLVASEGPSGWPAWRVWLRGPRASPGGSMTDAGSDSEEPLSAGFPVVAGHVTWECP
jgi:hypothetical protein